MQHLETLVLLAGGLEGDGAIFGSRLETENRFVCDRKVGVYHCWVYTIRIRFRTFTAVEKYIRGK